MSKGLNERLLIGNCLETIKTIPDNSIDSIVTDPPYELGFMGKSWDNSGVAYQVSLWQECLRVLKPGGHLLAFGGTRTYHRMAVAIEDAGFEIRDSIHWTYGSGFPKSLDISKAIDKRGGQSIAWFGSWLKNWREQNNISQKEIATLFLSKTGNLTGCVANWELGLSLPTAEQFTTICQYFNLPFNSIEEAERKIVGTKLSGIANKNEKNRHTIGSSKAIKVDITEPATDQAKQWQGWGTALKPSHEPIVLARKPLIGTVAENVLQHSTGGINIDGTRIGYEDTPNPATNPLYRAENGYKVPTGGEKSEGAVTWKSGKNPVTPTGRFPANTLLTHNHDCDNGCTPNCPVNLLDQQSGLLQAKRTSRGVGYTKSNVFGAGDPSFDTVRGYDDKGGASRFFHNSQWTPADDITPFIYQAKAGKKERNVGLDGLEAKRHSDRLADDLPGGNNPRNRTNEAKQNFHPTVKPIELMRYLIKLITPPKGTVLDPFLGSGTTAVAAILEGFDWKGCEMTEDYIPIIKGRVKWAEKEAKKNAKQEELNLDTKE